MEKSKHGKSANSAFLWGLIVGAILASLLTTKKGRKLLREIVDLGVACFEDFVEERKNKSYEKSIQKIDEVRVVEENEEIAQASEDLESGITEIETPEVADTVVVNPAPKEEIVIDEVSEAATVLAKKIDIVKEKTASKLGSKRRLFKGLRKHK